MAETNTIPFRNSASSTITLIFEPWPYMVELQPKEKCLLRIKGNTATQLLGFLFKDNRIIIYPVDGEFIDLIQNEQVILEF